MSAGYTDARISMALSAILLGQIATTESVRGLAKAQLKLMADERQSALTHIEEAIGALDGVLQSLSGLRMILEAAEVRPDAE